MKKKFLLISLMLALFVCVLAISVSAEETSVTDTDFVNNTLYSSTSNDFGTVNIVSDTSKVYYFDGTLDTTSRIVLKNANNTYSTYLTIYFMYTVTDSQGPRWGFDKINELTGQNYDITSVARIEFPEGTNHVRGSSFKNSTELVYAKIASTVKEIKGNAFDGCSNLAKVEFRYDYTKYPEFGSNLQSINNGAVFNKCTSLTELVLPNSVTSVNTGAISGCTNLVLFNPGASFTETNNQPIGSPTQKFILSEAYQGNFKLFSYNSVTKPTVSTSVVFYYTGTYEQAVALQGVETYTYEIANATLVSYDEFTSDTFIRDNEVHYFVYGYNKCEAFYGGIHKKENVNSCVDKCTVCNEYFAKEAPAHNITTTLDYENGFAAAGKKTVCCANEGCPLKAEAEVTSVDAIFAGFLYSTREEDGAKYGLVLTYSVNKEALTAYEIAMNTTLTYGVLAIAEQNVSGNPLENDGTPNVESIVATDVTGAPSVDFIIWGKADDWNTVIDEETGKTVKDISFYILGYVIEGDTLNYFYDVTSSETLTDLSTKSYNGAKA